MTKTKSKQGFTPGPWRVNGNRIEYGPYVAGSGWNVAEVRSDYNEPLEANAALIAAAPELLEACKLALNSWFNGEVSEIQMELVLRNAVAKAEGR